MLVFGIRNATWPPWSNTYLQIKLHQYDHRHHIYYSDVTMSRMSAMASQITGVSIICLDADQRKRQSSASLAFVKGFHRWPVDSSQRANITRKMSPFDDVNMTYISVLLLICMCQISVICTRESFVSSTIRACMFTTIIDKMTVCQF